MNFLKKGPQLKLPKFGKPSGGSGMKKPDIGVPAFASDIYYELRDRRLLPLVAFLLVAIVAVPIALSEGPSEEEENAAAVAGMAGASAAPASKQTKVVAKVLPGLRDYEKRLSHRSESNPFEPTGEAGAEVTGEGESSGEEASEVLSSGEEETTETFNPPVEPGSADNITYYSFAIDVRVTPVASNGVPSKAEPTVRRNLPELTMLPGRETPAVVFMGVTKDREKALMLVSSQVIGSFGDNVCAVGGDSCELIALEPGVPQTFVYGGNERVFRIELLKVALIRSDKVNKAPLGKPGKKQPSSAPQAELQPAE